jgi:hypothetical protein
MDALYWSCILMGICNVCAGVRIMQLELRHRAPDVEIEMCLLNLSERAILLESV